jgi:hypothetical protein
MTPISTSLSGFSLASKSRTNFSKMSTRYGFDESCRKNSNSFSVSWCHSLDITVMSTCKTLASCLELTFVGADSETAQSMGAVREELMTRQSLGIGQHQSSPAYQQPSVRKTLWNSKGDDNELRRDGTASLSGRGECTRL